MGVMGDGAMGRWGRWDGWERWLRRGVRVLLDLYARSVPRRPIDTPARDPLLRSVSSEDAEMLVNVTANSTIVIVGSDSIN